MKGSLKRLWTLAIAAALAAVALVAIQLAGQAGAARPAQQVARMEALLERDPQLLRPETRAAVAQVAELAASGARETAWTHLALGLRARGQRAHEAALDALRHALTLAPEDDPELRSLILNEIGISYHNLRRYGPAREALARSIELTPERARPYNDMGVLLRFTGELDEAESYALKALELAPEDVASHNNYGNLLVAQGRWEEAIERYHRAMELAPGLPHPVYNLACVYSLQGETARALDLLAQAIAIDPVWRAEARRDPDFEPLRGMAEFDALVAAG
jgi:tetratricopeptide (TPR) repeat protein